MEACQLLVYRFIRGVQGVGAGDTSVNTWQDIDTWVVEKRYSSGMEGCFIPLRATACVEGGCTSALHVAHLIQGG